MRLKSCAVVRSIDWLSMAAVLVAVLSFTHRVAAQEPPKMAPATINPSPGRGFVLSARFDDVPGPLKRLGAWAHYEVANRDCVAMDYTRAPGGVKLPPEHQMDVELKRLPDGSLRGIVFEDALVDADLFGLGICRWVLQSVTVGFESDATKFIGGLSVDKMRAGAVAVNHYLVRDFHQKPRYLEYTFGQGPDYYLKTLGPQFTLTITSAALK